MKLYVCWNATRGLWAPVLVTDEGEVVWDSKKIVAWAREHAAGGWRGATATS